MTEAQGTASQPSGGGARMSFMLEAEAASGVMQKLDSRAKGSSSRERIAALDSTVKQLAETRDKFQAARLAGVGNATIQQNMEDSKREVDEFMQAVTNLDKIIAGIGAEYVQLGERTPEEKKLIEDAERILEAAQRKWYLFSSWRDVAVSKAKSAFEEAKKVAEQMQRNRVLKTNMENAFQYLEKQHLNLKGLLKTRMRDLEIERIALDKCRQEALDIKVKAAEAVEALDKEIINLNHDLETLTHDLPSLTDPVVRAEHERKISDLEVHIKAKLAERDAAFVSMKARELFAEGLETAQKTVVSQKSSINMWYQKIEHEMPGRIQLYRTRLTTMRASADQRVGELLDDMTRKLDPDVLANITKDGVAAEMAITAVVEDMPKRLEEFEQISHKQAEEQQKIIDRMAAMIDEHRKRSSGAKLLEDQAA